MAAEPSPLWKKKRGREKWGREKRVQALLGRTRRAPHPPRKIFILCWLLHLNVFKAAPLEQLEGGVCLWQPLSVTSTQTLLWDCLSQPWGDVGDPELLCPAAPAGMKLQKGALEWQHSPPASWGQAVLCI